MDDLSRDQIPGWTYGIDPQAAGLVLRSVTRVDLPLGEGLRIEAAPPDAADDAPVHLQWYVATRMGPWAMWTVCAPAEVAGREAELQAIVWSEVPDVDRRGQDEPPAGISGLTSW